MDKQGVESSDSKLQGKFDKLAADGLLDFSYPSRPTDVNAAVQELDRFLRKPSVTSLHVDKLPDDSGLSFWKDQHGYFFQFNSNLDQGRRHYFMPSLRRVDYLGKQHDVSSELDKVDNDFMQQIAKRNAESGVKTTLATRLTGLYTGCLASQESYELKRIFDDPNDPFARVALARVKMAQAAGHLLASLSPGQINSLEPICDAQVRGKKDWNSGLDNLGIAMSPRRQQAIKQCLDAGLRATYGDAPLRQDSRSESMLRQNGMSYGQGCVDLYLQPFGIQGQGFYPRYSSSNKGALTEAPVNKTGLSELEAVRKQLMYFQQLINNMPVSQPNNQDRVDSRPPQPA